MRTIVIDTDPGLDDAIAILLALAFPEELKVAALTTVAGNVGLEKVTANALRLLEFARAEAPVAAGAARPLSGEAVHAAAIHGEDGLGGIGLPPPAGAADGRTAVGLIAEILRAAESPVDLVPIGPLTNIALLIRAHPELKPKIGLVSLMGGSASAGNVTAAAEFNVYADPEAAREVFASALPIVMSGLDVTRRAFLTPAEVRALGDRGPASALAAAILGRYAVRYEKAGMPGAAIHDACSVAYILRPELFSGEERFVDVETSGTLTRGMTVVDRRPNSKAVPNARVLLDLDRPRFVELLFEGFGRLDAMLNT